ncbi:hypothetical protein MAJ_06039, partial [Metarhizium majus ARSEF 297]
MASAFCNYAAQLRAGGPRPEARDWATSESGKPYFWYGVMVNKDQAESQTKKQAKAQLLFKFPRSKLGKGK